MIVGFLATALQAEDNGMSHFAEVGISFHVTWVIGDQFLKELIGIVPALLVEVKEAELKIAGQLIQALEAKFEPEKYHDTFEENLKQLIKARLEGKHVTEVEKERKPAPVVDLMAALKQSLSTMEKGKAEKKPASRVEQAQQESRIHVVGEKPGAAKSKKKRAA